MKAFHVLLAAVLISSSAAAQTRRKAPPAKAPAAAPGAWPIASINVTGNVLYPQPAIVRASGLRIGQRAGQADFDAARDRLLATGAFESVGYRFSPGDRGYAAVFDVVEVKQVFPFKFDSLNADEAALRRAVAAAEPLFSDRLPGTDAALKRYAKVVQDALAAQGKTEAVIAKLTSDAGDQLAIVFRPALLPSVAEVNFSGNKTIDTRTLQQAISGAAVGSIYSEKRFQEILDFGIRPLYEAQGRVRVRFPKITAEPVKAKDVRGLAVHVTIEEGDVYTLNEVRVEGVPDARELRKEAGLATSEPFNINSVRSAMENIRKHYQNKGYIHAVATLDRKIDDAKKLVDVIYKVTPGPQYSFGKLAIEGLNIQTEPHIRKLWNLKPGQAFNAGYPEYFLDHVRSEGVFENLGKTRADRKVDDTRRIVDVTLYFSTDGKPLPAIGAAREEQEREMRRRPEYPQK